MNRDIYAPESNTQTKINRENKYILWLFKSKLRRILWIYSVQK